MMPQVAVWCTHLLDVSQSARGGQKLADEAVACGMLMGEMTATSLARRSARRRITRVSGGTFLPRQDVKRQTLLAWQPVRPQGSSTCAHGGSDRGLPRRRAPHRARAELAIRARKGLSFLFRLFRQATKHAESDMTY